MTQNTQYTSLCVLFSWLIRIIFNVFTKCLKYMIVLEQCFGGQRFIGGLFIFFSLIWINFKWQKLFSLKVILHWWSQIFFVFPLIANIYQKKLANICVISSLVGQPKSLTILFNFPLQVRKVIDSLNIWGFSWGEGNHLPDIVHMKGNPRIRKV